MKPFSLFVFWWVVALVSLYADDLTLAPSDIRIEKDDLGFHLWIKKKPDVSSVLITESSRDPLKKADSFGLRSFDYYPINGDEKRMLDGKFLDSKNLYFLMSSSPVVDPVTNEPSFHILVPEAVTFGYPWSREGQVEIGPGSWLNLRTFAKPYADYSGAFADNPFVFRSRQTNPPSGAPKESEAATPNDEDPLKKMAETTGGKFSEVDTLDEGLNKIGEFLDAIPKTGADVILVLDTTISMKDFVLYIQKELLPYLLDNLKTFKDIRMGIVLYRDYKEEYLTRSYPFTSDLEEIQSTLDRVKVAGGRDIPEAVYEGIYAALTEFTWKAPNRIIFQVGDAPPHPTPRGDVTKEMVYAKAKEENVLVYPIFLKPKV